MAAQITVEDALQRISRDLGADLGRLKYHHDSKNIYLVEQPQYRFLRFTKLIENIEEGTAAFMTPQGLEYMRGFPKIRRALVLKAALKKHMPQQFYVEEKMNGYNVRVAHVDGKPIALTKGGLVCDYTTQEIKETFKDHSFFTDNPQLMLCGEVVGLMNPYQIKSYPKAQEFGFFVFDIRDKTTGKALPIGRKLEFTRKYGLQSVKNFGLFSQKDAVKLNKLVLKLGAQGREGIVLKAPDMSAQLKYTANKSTNTDLNYAFKFMFDYGQAFMFRRLVREAFQAYELGLEGKALEKEAAALGKSIMLPMLNTIKQVASGKEVTEDFDIKVPSEDFGKQFIDHLRHLGVRLTITSTKRKGKHVILHVKRHYPSTNDKIKAYLRGEFCQE